MTLGQVALSIPVAPRPAARQYEVTPFPSRITGLTEMADRVRAHPWQTTSLGAIEHWTEASVAIVNLVLAFPLPAFCHLGPDLLFINNDHVIALLGPGYEDALGCTAEEVWQNILPQVSHDARSVLQTNASVFNESIPVPRTAGPSARERFWNYTMTPMFAPDGSTLGVFATGRDMTESVKANNALAESDERLRLALSFKQFVGIWDWHIQQDRFYQDEKFARFYGVDPTRPARLADFTDRIHPGDKARILEALDRALETGEEYSQEHRVIRPDGAVRWIAGVGRCAYTDNGQPSRFTGLVLDVTERHQTEAALRDQERENERRTAAATLASAIGSRVDQPLYSVATLLRLARAAPDLTEAKRFLVVAERDLGRAADIFDRALSSLDPALFPEALAADLDARRTVTRTTQLPNCPSAIWSMQLLLTTIAQSLVSRQEAISVQVERTPTAAELVLCVARNDMGQMLGRQGKTAQAIRTLVHAAGAKSDQRFTLDIRPAQD